MFLGTTAYLIGLLSVIVPITIHLWSKKTRKTIPFGTIRFLTEDDTQAIKSLIPTEWLLLFLRIMMLVVFVLIMSEPLWKMKKETSGIVMVDPAYDTSGNSLHSAAQVVVAVNHGNYPRNEGSRL